MVEATGTLTSIVAGLIGVAASGGKRAMMSPRAAHATFAYCRILVAR